MKWELRRSALVMAAGLAVGASLAVAGPEDHTRRGLGRSSPPPQQQAPSGNDGGSQAPPPQAAAPTPAPASTPAPAAAPVPQAAPPGAVAPPSGLIRGPAGPRQGDGRPVIIGTPQNPATTDETRRALALPTRSAPRRMAGTVDLPSGAETARLHQQGLLRAFGTAESRDIAPASPAGALTRRDGGSALAFHRNTDNTRRDLNGASAGSGGSSQGSWWRTRHGYDRSGHRNRYHSSGGPWFDVGAYDSPTLYHDPWTNWSSGIPTVPVDPYGGFGRDPWSYSQFNYGGPGWYLSNDWTARPYEFSYHPYLGENVWQFESSAYPVTTFGETFDPYAFSDFSGGLTGDPPVSPAAVAPSAPTQVYSTALPRVNSAYDVRGDFASSVEAALGGEFSSSIYTMRRAAGVNPGGLVGSASGTRRAIASDPAWGQRVRAALLVFQNPPTRVVSETDAKFMVAVLSGAMGEEEAARAAVAAAIDAGDAASSTALLGKALRGEPLESSGPWITGQPVRK